ncbi:hypothetical protein ACHMW5_30035 [Azospirillum melinis]|uniref:hypothetical protein n=1 Tax=Azospirillum melinis TaxID=328839 RepID=UPI0037583670
MSREDWQEDLFSDLTELDLVRYIMADTHNDLHGKVARLRQITDLGRELGLNGTMIFGAAASLAWEEARSSFVHGNFVSTVLLCQSMAEQLLAAFLCNGLMENDLPRRVDFKETLKRCYDNGILSEQDTQDLKKLMNLRNPLSHFRHIDDDSSVERRFLNQKEPIQEFMRRDAQFAIGLATRILSKNPFRVD